MLRYRLFKKDGSDVGDAHYPVPVRAGEMIRTGDGRRLRVLSLIEKHDESSRYAGLLMVQDA